jgi:hypothetical protein
MVTYIYSHIYTTLWAPGVYRLLHEVSSCYCEGGVSVHYSRLKRPPVLPQSVPHYSFWNYGIVLPQHPVQRIALIVATP